MSKEVYNENSIITLNPREAVRESLGMYIGSNDSEGLHHLLTEIVANSMDEAAAGYGNIITITIDKSENRATVKDKGRGIPFHRNDSGNYAIVEMCTNLHSGGKFEGQGNYKSSLGLNGVGATVTCALSTEYIINVWRDGEHCEFGVYDGEYDDPTIEKYKGSEQGTEVSFIPDNSVFKGIKWDINKIKEKIQLNALLNNGIKFEIIYKDGDEVIEKTTYYYTNGIKDMLNIRTADLKMITDPVYFSTTTTNDAGEECVTEMAFAYCDRAYDTIYSFVNGGYTPHDGTHVTGWKSAFTSLINKMAREQEVLKDKDKNFNGDMIRRGLVLVLSIKVNFRPMFAEQTKLTLNSPSARGLVSKAVGELTLDKKAAKQILDKVMIEQKAEDAAQRKREAQEKIAKGGKSMNSLRDLPAKLADASDFTDAEIFFVEGDSAAGSGKEMKNQSQAIMPLRGKVKNCTSLELADTIKSDIIRDILTCLGCGIGDNFDIHHLRYNRIIICCDSDPDGGHIELLLLTLFLHHLPELIRQEKVYIAVSPLYKTTTQKETIYWYPDQLSEYKKYVRNHANVKINRFKGLGELNAEELYSTTMDPSNRKLIQLTTDNFEETLELYDRLMGKQPSLRRDFILNNKLSKYNQTEDDNLFDDDEEDYE